MPIPKLPLPMLAGGAIAGIFGMAIVMSILAAIVNDINVVKLVLLVLAGIIGSMIVSVVVGGIVLAIMWPATQAIWSTSRVLLRKKG